MTCCPDVNERKHVMFCLNGARAKRLEDRIAQLDVSDAEVSTRHCPCSRSMPLNDVVPSCRKKRFVVNFEQGRQSSFGCAVLKSPFETSTCARPLDEVPLARSNWPRNVTMVKYTPLRYCARYCIDPWLRFRTSCADGFWLIVG